MALGITGCYTKTQASAILEAGVDSGWSPLPKVSGAIGRAMTFRVGRKQKPYFFCWNKGWFTVTSMDLGVSPSQLKG